MSSHEPCCILREVMHRTGLSPFGLATFCGASEDEIEHSLRTGEIRVDLLLCILMFYNGWIDKTIRRQKRGL